MNPAWQHHPFRSAFKFAATYVRRLHPRLRHVVVPFDGGRSRIVAELDTSIGRGLYRYGCDDPDLGLVARLLEPGDWFIDGGANVGLFSLVAANRIGPSGRVLSFEPAPLTHARLKRNISINDYGWIDARVEALGESPGNAEFIAFGGNSSGVSSFAPADLSTGVLQTVSLTSIDVVLQGFRKPPLRLIKLDLEGAEMKALLGSRQTLREHGPDLLIEVEREHLARQGSSPEEVFSFLQEFGYLPFCLKRVGLSDLVLEPAKSPLDRGPSPNFLLSKDRSRLCRAGVLV